MVSYIDERYSLELCPNRGLSVLQCGWQKCDAGHQNGFMRYNHYSITFVISGSGSYTINGQTFSIHQGEGFVIFPESIPLYVADNNDPWEYVFAVFQGSDVPKMLQVAGISAQNPIFQYSRDEQMMFALNQLRIMSKSGLALGYDVVGQFYICISKLIQQQTAKIQKQIPILHYVEIAKAYMETNYPYHISITDVASYVGVDRSYLYRLFLESEGISPSVWLMRLRLEHSVKMLQEGLLSITEIAYSIGFYDVSHFTKSFKKEYGCTPREYLNMHRNVTI